MRPAIDDHKRGDYWEGVSIRYELQTEDGLIPVDLTGASVLIEFKASKKGKVDFTYSTDNSNVSLGNPTLGIITLAPGLILHNPNTYYFDVQITYQNGKIETIASSSWTITSDISDNDIEC